MPQAPPAPLPTSAVSDTSGFVQPLEYLTVCAWCGRSMGRGPATRRAISHGICRSCSDEALFSDEAAIIVPR